ncbi:MAG: DoxX family protein [Proteobacteria bacterium]|nr:DoxX family protein [Pseudomonadota bacterium]
MADASTATNVRESRQSTRGRIIGYWITTGLLCLPMLMGGFLDLIQSAQVLEVLEQLGYPHYFASMLGVAKLLGVIAVLVPGWPRLKEWAYAGFTFDLLAAAISHVIVSSPFSEVAIPFAILGIGAASYLLRPPSRRLS